MPKQLIPIRIQNRINSLPIKKIAIGLCILTFLFLGIAGIAQNLTRTHNFKTIASSLMTQFTGDVNEHLIVFGQGLLELRGVVLSTEPSLVKQYPFSEAKPNADDEQAKPVSVSEVFNMPGAFGYGFLRSQMGGASTNHATVIGRRLQSYMSSQNLTARFPGLSGMGYIERVPQDGLGKFIGDQRLNGRAGFTLKQIGKNPNDFYVVQYVEPLDANFQLVGLDVASDIILKSAADQAAKTGQTVMTAPIKLIQENGRPDAQLLLFSPIYTPDMPLGSDDQRVQAIKGWVFFRILPEALFQEMYLRNKNLEYVVIDDGEGDRTRFWSTPGYSLKIMGVINAEKVLSAFGRSWILDIQTTPFFSANTQEPSRWIWAFSILSILIAIGMIGLFFIYPSVRDKQITS